MIGYLSYIARTDDTVKSGRNVFEAGKYPLTPQTYRPSEREVC